jgi:hypothetical protein
LYYILRSLDAVFNSGVLTLHYPDGLGNSNYQDILDSATLKTIEEKFSLVMGTQITVKNGKPAAPAEKKIAENKTEPVETAEDDNSAPLSDSEMILNPEKEDYNIESHAVNKLQSAFHGQIIKKGDGVC